MVRNFHEISIKKKKNFIDFIPLFKLVQHLEIMSLFLETNSKGIVLSLKKIVVGCSLPPIKRETFQAVVVQKRPRDKA